MFITILDLLRLIVYFPDLSILVVCYSNEFPQVLADFHKCCLYLAEIIGKSVESGESY